MDAENTPSEGFINKVKRKVADNFNQSIDVYQAFEGKHRFFSALALKLAETIGLVTGSSVLDVGCGYGLSSRVLNEQFGCRVLGVDLSPRMIAAGQSVCDGNEIQLIVGDGEKLSHIAGDRRFDFALYNASIFIFPDVSKTIGESFDCLRPGGKIAFSFYPQIMGDDDEDLVAAAYHRLGEPLPRRRVITDYSTASDALKLRCGNITHHRWVRPLDINFLQDFFSIPAQSTSLFPKHEYEDRRDLVKRLFETLGDRTGKGRIVWRMAEATKMMPSNT